MAKALFGSVATPAAAQAHQIASQRRRIAELEAEVLRLNAENDRLRAAVEDRDLDPTMLFTPSDLFEPLAR